MEQGNVMHQPAQPWRGDGLAAEGDDEGAPAVGVDVGRGLAEPGDEGVRGLAAGSGAWHLDS